MNQSAAYRIVANALGVPVESLNAESGLNHHPAWDSLGHVAVILALEKELGITIDDSTVLEYASMNKILELASSASQTLAPGDETIGGNKMISREVSFTSFDGLPLAGTLEAPGNAVRGRALLIHGMTANREEWGFFTQLGRRFGEIGVASLRIDYRCHGEAAALPTTDLSLAGIANDVDAAYAALLGAVPGERLPTFFVATSFGGGVAAFWAKRRPGKVRVLFLCYPVLDYLADFDKTCGNWRDELRQTGVFTYVSRKLSRAIANEAPYFDGLDTLAEPPMHHGDSDNDVPVQKSRHYAGLSKKVTLVEVPGADHGFVVPGDMDVKDARSQQNFEFVYARLLARCEEELRGGRP
jgi:acyl carrier protein